MSDDTNNTGSPDNKLVSLSQDHEVRYWTDRFNVTESLLRRAVTAAGNSVDAVERWLNSNR